VVCPHKLDERNQRVKTDARHSPTAQTAGAHGGFNPLTGFRVATGSIERVQAGVG
jgi:hypothetical protein